MAMFLNRKQITFGDFLTKLESIEQDGCGDDPVVVDCGESVPTVPTGFDCCLGGKSGYLELQHIRRPSGAHLDYTINTLLSAGKELADDNCLSVLSVMPLLADRGRRYVIGIQRQDDDYWKILTSAVNVVYEEDSLALAAV